MPYMFLAFAKIIKIVNLPTVTTDPNPMEVSSIVPLKVLPCIDLIQP